MLDFCHEIRPEQRICFYMAVETCLDCESGVMPSHSKPKYAGETRHAQRAAVLSGIVSIS
jgi:hypothetical protein